MMQSNEDKIRAGTNPNFSDDTVRIKAGSFVIENKWINFNGTLFKITEYIDSVLRGSRTRFFKDRSYAVYIMVGLDPSQGIRSVEGTHVPFTTIQAVPPPEEYSFLPLVGIVLVQDGTRDLNYGYVPLKNENVIFFSGYGNVIERDLKGARGDASQIYGETGLYGITGFIGVPGPQGTLGITGQVGSTPAAPRGYTGMGGMTGISWGIHIPFQEFF
jgi:hypothetical protein